MYLLYVVNFLTSKKCSDPRMQCGRLVFHILGYHLSLGNRDFKSPDTAEFVTVLKSARNSLLSRKRIFYSFSMCKVEGHM